MSFMSFKTNCNLPVKFFLIYFVAIFIFSIAVNADETVFNFNSGKFTGNEGLPTNKWGWESKIVKKGAQITFNKYSKGATKYPLLNIKTQNFKNADWREYDFLCFRLKNHELILSPYIAVRFRACGKYYSYKKRIRCNSVDSISVKLSNIAAQIDINKIDLIQVCYTRPSQKTTLTLYDIVLRGSSSAQKQNSPVPHRYDFLKEIAVGNSCWHFIGGNMKTGKDGSIELDFKKYSQGMDCWPSLNGFAGYGDGMNSGNWDCWTHCEIEIEGVKTYRSLGLTIRDNQGRKVWCSTMSIPGKPVKKTALMYNTGFNRGAINRLSFGCTRPEKGFKVLIKKLSLVFKPQVISRDVLNDLIAMKDKKISPELHSKLDAALVKLQKSLVKVKGEKSAYQDIQAFFSALKNARTAYAQISRQHSLNLLRDKSSTRDFSVGIADSMESVKLCGAELHMRPALKAELGLAANEYESLQLVIASGKKELKNVCVYTTSPTGPGGHKLQIKTSLVGHAKTKQPEYQVDYVGYYPDFIMEDVKTADLAPGETTPFWIRYYAPKGTPAGIYHGQIKVSLKGREAYSLPVKVRVFDFELPDGMPLPSSNNFKLGDIAKAYKLRKDSQTYYNLVNQLIELAAKYKISFDTLYRGPYTSCNPSKDKIYPILKGLAHKKLLKSYCIVNATLPKSVTRLDDPRVKSYMERLERHIKCWKPVAEKAGVYQYAYTYGYDEAYPGPMMEKIYAKLKELCPDRPLLSTGCFVDIDAPAFKYVDAWVPIAAKYVNKADLVEKMRANGKKVWWYVCNFPRPPHPTLLLEGLGVAPRLLMGMMTAKYRPDGFLYYSVIRWDNSGRSVIKESGPRTSWDPTLNTGNECGNLFVPGFNYRIWPTLRIENFRDGVEDYWYYRILEDLIKKGRQEQISTELLKKASKKLNVPKTIVKNPYEYTRNPELVRKERRELASLIEKLKHAIKLR
jgi:hypothetical protein